MDRRNFLKAIALTGAAFTTMKEADAMSILTQGFESANAATKYDLVEGGGRIGIPASATAPR